MSTRWRRGRQGERGVTLVETAIVGLLVFTLILALFEFGLLFRDNLSATDAVADAARIGAIVGPDVNNGATADYEIVRALREGLSAVGDQSIESIVVFKASGTGDPAEQQVPMACRQGNSISGICNAYDANAAFNAVAGGNTAYFLCSATHTASCSWNPTAREDGPASSDVETLGVYLRIRRSGYTGLFADSWTITRATAVRLEPGVTEP